VKLVVDTNVLISALIADSATRTLLATVDVPLLAPERLRDEVEKHTDLIQEKSGLSEDEVEQSVENLFEHIETVPRSEVEPFLQEARREIGETDEDDVVFLATALAEDANVWSDDTDFQKQGLVPVYTTSDILEEVSE
jgi:predicted nucleic acid-binding protein